MCLVDQLDKPYSIEMVLIDSDGVKIQAAIRKPMSGYKETHERKFRTAIVEGEVYKISYIAYIGVIRNIGSCRATDVVGVLSAVSEEIVSVKDGRITRMDGFIDFTEIDAKTKVLVAWLADTGEEASWRKGFLPATTAAGKEEGRVRQKEREQASTGVDGQKLSCGWCRKWIGNTHAPLRVNSESHSRLQSNDGGDGLSRKWRRR
ncbi:hypothetical protein SESBI_13001 [Sesbania bispinosa]|nr:hypothetical protein SESBI_13001 [Sesbania bispinosa]